MILGIEIITGQVSNNYHCEAIFSLLLSNKGLDSQDNRRNKTLNKYNKIPPKPTFFGGIISLMQTMPMVTCRELSIPDINLAVYKVCRFWKLCNKYTIKHPISTYVNNFILPNLSASFPDVKTANIAPKV
jgi:hypothetical protein